MIGRRHLVALLGGSALAWPAIGRAQQPLPVVGFLDAGSPEAMGHLAAAFRAGLSEAGYIDGRNAAVEYRWAQGRFDQVPALATELAERGVDVIFAGSTTPALASQAATALIPIVFITGADPVTLGLVASLSRPGGNLTGVSTFARILEQKRLELLHELVPSARTIAVLLNQTQANYQDQSTDLADAARLLRLQLRFLAASTGREIEAAFATIANAGLGALIVTASSFFSTQRDLIFSLAARHRLPAMYPLREYTIAGGLMSYGTSMSDAYRQAGIYVGRILNGEKAADLPVVQSDTFDFVINLRTAQTLDLTIPASLLLRATEVIE